MKVRIGRVGPERIRRFLQLAPRAPYQFDEHVASKRVAEFRALEGLVVGRVDQRIEQRHVSLARQAGLDVLTGGGSALIEALGQGSDGAGVVWSQVVHLGVQALRQHVDVAGQTNFRAQPLQLVAEPSGATLIEQLSKCVQIGPEPAGGDTELVDVFMVVSEPDTGMMREHLGDGVCDRVAYNGASGRTLADGHGILVGRTKCAISESASCLRNRVVVSTACSPHRLHQSVDRLGADIVASQFELYFPKGRGAWFGTSATTTSSHNVSSGLPSNSSGTSVRLVCSSSTGPNVCERM